MFTRYILMTFRNKEFASCATHTFFGFTFSFTVTLFKPSWVDYVTLPASRRLYFFLGRLKKWFQINTFFYGWVISVLVYKDVPKQLLLQLIYYEVKDKLCRLLECLTVVTTFIRLSNFRFYVITILSACFSGNFVYDS